MRKKISVVDVFCGVGGLSLGLKQAGLTVVGGIDLDPSCKYPFEENIGARFVLQDAGKVTPATIAGLFGKADVRVLAGCAPCQPFSGYTARQRETDSRWELLVEFLRLVKAEAPEIVTVENVPRLAHRPLWREFVGALSAAGYCVAWDIMDACQYGVPQSRRRLVLLASRLGPIELPQCQSSKPVRTVRDAISGLPGIAAGAVLEGDRLHASRALTAVNLKRIQASRPAGTWREWPKAMRAECHRRTAGRTYPSVYGRMSWDRPSPTITTQFYGFGNGRFGHPEQDRALSLREGAILQSFQSPREPHGRPSSASEGGGSDQGPSECLTG